MANVEPVPREYHVITPSIVVSECAKAIDFYVRALGAQERGRMLMPDGRVAHAEIQIGDSILMLADEMGMGAKSPQTLNGVTCTFHLYVPDADASFQRALDAGASVVSPMEDSFWGDRYGIVRDPFGQVWGFATRQRVVSDEEMKRALDAMAKAP